MDHSKMPKYTTTLIDEELLEHYLAAFDRYKELHDEIIERFCALLEAKRLRDMPHDERMKLDTLASIVDENGRIPHPWDIHEAIEK